MYLGQYVLDFTHTHTHTHTHTYIHTHAHTHKHTYKHTHIHTLSQHTHKHKHTHTHTHTQEKTSPVHTHFAHIQIKPLKNLEENNGNEKISTNKNYKRTKYLSMSAKGGSFYTNMCVIQPRCRAFKNSFFTINQVKRCQNE
jgi:hypothetical protein